MLFDAVCGSYRHAGAYESVSALKATHFQTVRICLYSSKLMHAETWCMHVSAHFHAVSGACMHVCIMRC
jgi:hypothetical protein